MGEHLVAAVAVLDLDVTAVGRASDWTARWAVDGAAGRALDGLAGLEVAQHGLFPVVQLDQHGWYLV